MSQKIPATRIRVQRAYQPPSPDDGARILVDRLWPRGLSKEKLGNVAWVKDVAPSDALRKWFGHEPAKWAEFQRRYKAELRQHHAELERLREIATKGTLTLVYGARDEQHNDAVVLREVLLHGH